eukprot:s998_g11.t1
MPAWPDWAMMHGLCCYGMTLKKMLLVFVLGASSLVLIGLATALVLHPDMHETNEESRWIVVLIYPDLLQSGRPLALLPGRDRAAPSKCSTPVVVKTCLCCLDDFEESNKVAILPCGHIFHEACIKSWSLSLAEAAGSCPACRAQFHTAALV